MEQNSEQKVLENEKTKSVNAEVIKFIPIQNLHRNFVCFYCAEYKAMSNTTDPELILNGNVCNAAKNFDFTEIKQPFRFVRVEECTWVCYSLWEDKTALFYLVIKMWGNLYEKPYQHGKQ